MHTHVTVSEEWIVEGARLALKQSQVTAETFALVSSVLDPGYVADALVRLPIVEREERRTRCGWSYTWLVARTEHEQQIAARYQFLGYAGAIVVTVARGAIEPRERDAIERLLDSARPEWSTRDHVDALVRLWDP